jgi:glycosyltransferase involved in cell wall biosynthesis
MNSPKVTIVIPVYNVREFIIDCLTSVFEQDYKNIEIILVNDRSVDGSIEIAANLISENDKKFPVKIIHHETNMGVSAARNTGIKNASGDYIFFLDSDDTLLPNSISTLIERIKTDDTDIIIGNFISDNNFPYFNNSRYLSYPETLVSFLTESYYAMAWNKLIKLQFLKAYSLLFIDGIYHEDMLFSFFLALYSKKIIITDKITYRYHKRSGSIMSAFNEKHIKDLLFIINEEIKIFKNNQLLFLFHRYIINKCYYVLTIIFKCSPINTSYIKNIRHIINSLNDFSFSRKKILILSPVPFIQLFFFVKKSIRRSFLGDS